MLSIARVAGFMRILNRVCIVLVVAHLVGAPILFASPRDRYRNRDYREYQPQDSKKQAVLHYLKNELSLKPEALSEFHLTLELQERLKRISPTQHEDRAWQEETLKKYFSPSSQAAIGEIIRTMARTEYNNAVLLGEGGAGKSHSLTQLVSVLSFGVVPDFLTPEFEIKDNPDALKIVREAIIGKTDVVLINNHLLSQDPTEKGQAFSSEPMRMRKILHDLFDAARAQFENGGNRVEFIIDEIQDMPDLIKDSLKKILDKSGFHDPNDPHLRVNDRGFSLLVATTPSEFRAFFKGNAPAERRLRKIYQKEPSEAEAFRIVRNKADVEWTNLYGMLLTDDAIKYIIRNRKLLANPPQAMPGIVLTSANDLFLHPNDYIDSGVQIDTKAAKRYLMKQSGLTDLWFEGPKGEPPMWDLAARVKKRVIGQDEVVDKIAERIKTWARLGFGSDVPVFFLGGPSGSGKDTLVKAFSQELFGHTSEHMTWGIGGAKDFKLESIFEGPPVGNHSDRELPRLAKAIDSGPRSSLIVLNEVKDTPTEQIEKLKLPLEQAMISPAGTDSRPRILLFPIFLLGQWGEEIFEGMSDEQIAERYKKMTQAQIERPFLEGKGNSVGAVPVAIMGRAKRTGGVYMLMPVAKRHYPKIVNLYTDSMSEKLLVNQAIKLSVRPELHEYVSLVATKLGEGTRALEAITIDFSEGAISKAIDQGLALHNTEIELSVRPAQQWNEAEIIVKSGERQWLFKASELYRGKSMCENLLTQQALPDAIKPVN